MSHHSSSPYSHTIQQGFTLLELLVVVSIMAIIAGSSIYASRTSTIEKAADTAVTAEMHNIRKALLQYKTDNFEFPVQTSPADFEFLFSKPTDIEKLWNNDYQKGWRGPYLTSGDSGLVDIGDNLDINGSGKPHIIYNNAKNLQRGIPDPFSFPPVFNGDDKSSIASPCDETKDDNYDNDRCLLDWRMLGQTRVDAPLEIKGRPYLAFDLNEPDKARIVSMGKNGIYKSGTVGNSCSGYVVPDDDLILCLY